jgi:hypothetical protein
MMTEQEERAIDRMAIALTMLIGTPIILALANVGLLPICGV